MVLKSAETVQRETDENDEGAKAPHGDSSDEEDNQLAEKLRDATGSVTLVPCEAALAISEPRSAAYDEEEQKSVVASSKATQLETNDEARAGSQVSKITEPDEPGKRRRQSKSKRAKKAAKVKKKEHSPRASLPPDEESDDDQGGFEGLQGLIPDPEVRSAFTEMTRLNRGYRAQSESARSAASRISELMLQMGQEHVKLEEARRNEKGLMRAKNRLLKQTIGLLRRGPQSSTQAASAPEPIAEQVVESQDDSEDDPLEVNPREPGSAQQRD